MSEKITSRQNTRVKEAAKLRGARQRTKQGRFLIDGAREIVRALDSEIEIVEAFVCPPLCTLDASQTAVARLNSGEAVVADVTPEVFEKLAFGERNDGIVVVAKTPTRNLSQLRLPAQPLVAVLEGLEKPGNVGAILRTADGAGFDAVIVADGQTDLFNPNTIRASLGTVFANQVYPATNEETLAKLQEWKLPLFAARPNAKQSYAEVDYRNGAAILLGNEAQGLSEFWNHQEVQGICLPMHGIADSLNVAATAAVLFYEANRQRR
ncbi:MAG: RNA methyltransferase [Planctomycetes bacterium]|nr:RNA methyltransferase [Planctomycetota bacterium]